MNTIRWRVAAAAMVGPSVAFVGLSVLSAPGRWNDFTTYWLAGKLVAAGISPYDLAALIRLGREEGVDFLAGTGYSYLPPFAVIMAPLGHLPLPIAALTFTILSVGAFGLTAALWLGDGRLTMHGTWTPVAAAFAAGLYPPVIGSVWMGQVNLLVFALLLVGVRGWLTSAERSGLVAGIWIGLAAVIKVVPFALLVPAILGTGNRRVTLGIGLGSAAVVAGAVAMGPSTAPGSEPISRLFAPDPYWTNQSINGLASRLTMPTERSSPLLPQVDGAVLGWLLVALLGVGTLAVLAIARRRLAEREGLALAIGLVLVAALAAAPKDSFWNHTPALLAAGVLLSGVGSPRRLDRLTIALLTTWFALAVAQLFVDHVATAVLASMGSLSSVLSSTALYGLLALWAAFAQNVLADPGRLRSALLAGGPASLRGPLAREENRSSQRIAARNVQGTSRMWRSPCLALPERCGTMRNRVIRSLRA